MNVDIYTKFFWKKTINLAIYLVLQRHYFISMSYSLMASPLLLKLESVDQISAQAQLVWAFEIGLGFAPPFNPLGLNWFGLLMGVWLQPLLDFYSKWKFGPNLASNTLQHKKQPSLEIGLGFGARLNPLGLNWFGLLTGVWL